MIAWRLFPGSHKVFGCEVWLKGAMALVSLRASCCFQEQLSPVPFPFWGLSGVAILCESNVLPGKFGSALLSTGVNWGFPGLPAHLCCLLGVMNTFFCSIPFSWPWEPHKPQHHSLKPRKRLMFQEKKSSFLMSYCKTMISVSSSLLALMWLLTWCITSPGPTPTEFTPPGNFSLYFDPNHSVSSVRNVCVSPSKLQIYRSWTLSYLPLYP